MKQIGRDILDALGVVLVGVFMLPVAMFITVQLLWQNRPHKARKSN